MSMAARRQLVEVLLAVDRSELLGEVQVCLEQAMTELEQRRAQPGPPRAYAAYGGLLRQRGCVDDALRYLTPGGTVFERLGAVVEPQRVRGEFMTLPVA